MWEQKEGVLLLLLISSDCASHAGSRAPACTCPGMRICSCSSGSFFCLILTKKTKEGMTLYPVLIGYTYPATHPALYTYYTSSVMYRHARCAAPTGRTNPPPPFSAPCTGERFRHADLDMMGEIPRSPEAKDAVCMCVDSCELHPDGLISER